MRKIGILDSGLGGFSLLKDLMESSLDAEYFFITDNDHVPYGEKSQNYILERMKVLTQKLLDQNVEAIIIACNTATVETINKLRDIYNVKFFGIEPYINYINHSTNEKLALILTEATFKSERFKFLVNKFDPKREVSVFPLKNLAIIIEKLYKNSFSEIKNEVFNELEFLNEEKFDSLILGCTHYPLIKNYIENEFKIKTIDPNKYVIKEVIKNLSLKHSALLTSFYFNYNASSEWSKREIKDYKLFH